METELVGPLNITVEEWREYDFANRAYRIQAPISLYYRKGGSTHRVVDSHGIAHCVPAPGVNGCVLRWKNFAGNDPVSF